MGRLWSQLAPARPTSEIAGVAVDAVDVGRSFGEKTEAMIIQIDCAGTVSFDDDGIDMVIEVLENARDNLRRPPWVLSEPPSCELACLRAHLCTSGACLVAEALLEGGFLRPFPIR